MYQQRPFEEDVMFLRFRKNALEFLHCCFLRISLLEWNSKKIGVRNYINKENW